MSKAACGRAFGHPEDAEALVVGHERAGADGVDELGAEHRAGDGQRALAAVEVGLERVARAEAVRRAKGSLTATSPAAVGDREGGPRGGAAG
jgi:hypothetical protein